MFVAIICMPMLGMTQPPPDPPPDHGTLGELPEAWNISSDNPMEYVFWQIDMEAIDCEGIGVWCYFTVKPDNDPNNPIIVDIDATELTGTFDLDKAKLIANNPMLATQGFDITHVSFILTVNGVPQSVYFYPGQNGSVATTMDPPCDCLYVSYNHTLKKLYFTYSTSCN